MDGRPLPQLLRPVDSQQSRVLRPCCVLVPMTTLTFTGKNASRFESQGKKTRSFHFGWDLLNKWDQCCTDGWCSCHRRQKRIRSRVIEVKTEEKTNVQLMFSPELADNPFVNKWKAAPRPPRYKAVRASLAEIEKIFWILQQRLKKKKNLKTWERYRG